MKNLSIDVEEPFTLHEVCAVLGLTPQDYLAALDDGSLQCSGVIRYVLPCQLPHHNFWDLYQYFIFLELDARHRVALALRKRITSFLDELASASEEKSLDHQLIKCCVSRLDARDAPNCTQEANIYDELLSRAVLDAFDNVNSALERVFATNLHFASTKLLEGILA